MSQFRRARARVTALDICTQARLEVETRGEGFTDLTREARAFLAEVGARDGMLHLFCRHTSASLTIQENADPDVRVDLLTALRRLAPADHPWVHDLEGPDDMPAHIRTALTASDLSIPVADGAPLLGTWQAIYLIEHRSRPHVREVVLSFCGESGR
ncbi:secondary thiamine-phosphate synthase enzyme YjbQ [Roseixanthobacter pseudopolyaromaticivorans]|uniref:secondary thiamine-phosphate synthase enzyme YjbQ n=1 Tax=Xanthobacteraceae TaxID=335928 RepID=UPI00372795AA